MIEDETFTRTQLSAHFEKGGYTVYAKQDADGVADFVKRKDIDLVLLDINLPGKDGVTLARELPAGDAADEENILHFERSLDNFVQAIQDYQSIEQGRLDLINALQNN